MRFVRIFIFLLVVVLMGGREARAEWVLTLSISCLDVRRYPEISFGLRVEWEEGFAEAPGGPADYIFELSEDGLSVGRLSMEFKKRLDKQTDVFYVSYVSTLPEPSPRTLLARLDLNGAHNGPQGTSFVIFSEAEEDGSVIGEATCYDGGVNSESPVRLFIGSGHPSVGGVAIFSQPDMTKKHHILSQDGETLYIGEIKEREYESCTDSTVVDWLLVPKEPKVLAQVSDFVIVVETADVKPFGAVKSKKIEAESSKTVNDYIHQRILPAVEQRSVPDRLRKGSPGKIKYESISAGTKGDRARILILAWEEGIFGAIKRVVSIVEVGHDYIEELFAVPIEEQVGEDHFLIYEGMADVDSDGFADVFLIEYGDFDGKELFIQEGSTWHRQRDDWGEPC